jgi:hypothetical protein
VANHQALGEHVYFYDMYHQLRLTDISDGLHPTAAGYNKMGDAWFKAIQAVPEPSSLALVCVGGLALLGYARRLRKSLANASG